MIAELRALDRSEKHYRKWKKELVQMKSFTGSTWNLPRGTTPEDTVAQGSLEDFASGDGSK